MKTKTKTTDVAIIGGGLAGILCAYLLDRAGKRVVLYEENELGSGVTSLTTAMITEDLDTDTHKLIAMFGLRTARLIRKSHAQAIDLLEDIIKRERIECHFSRCPAYRYASSPKQLKHLKTEYQAIKKLGFAAELQETRIKLPRQAKFYASEFIAGLKKKLSRRVKIHEKTNIKDLKDIHARDIVVATHQPFNNPWPTFMKKGMYVSYVLDARVPRGTFEESINFDFSNPYFYYRVDALNKKEDSIIIGGADHRKELPMSKKKAFGAVREHLDKLLKGIKHRVVSRWTGPILESIDGLALIGSYRPHEYVATAFSGNGMTYAGIAAKLITDLISKKSNPYQSIYSPKRIPGLYQLAQKGKDYAGELIGGTMKKMW